MAAALLSVSCVALGLLAAPGRSHAQSTGVTTSAGPGLAARRDRSARTGTSNTQRANRSAAAAHAGCAPAADRTRSAVPFSQSQDARTGTVGVYSNSTSVATKTNTPLVNIPQSVNVVTKEFIRDQSFQSLTDVTRYVPGVAIHQGEGNRDELVIRGVDSSANFFVNGFRDDVQYFRDLYNTQSIEVLKGPSALIFGRGAGGGLVNRTLKEADGTRVYEATGQVGSWNDKRVTLDAGQAVNENVAVRFNAMYENSDTFRQYGHLERYGINPTVTLKPDDDTKIKLCYEFFHDFRLADRGNPSQGLPLFAPGATRFNPTAPFAPNGNLSVFFGSPDLQLCQGRRADRHGGDRARFRQRPDHEERLDLRRLQPWLPERLSRRHRRAGSSGGGAVLPNQTLVTLNAYQNDTPRENLFNQNDWVCKTNTGPVLHTLAFGTEFGRQTGVDAQHRPFPANGGASIGRRQSVQPDLFRAGHLHHIANATPTASIGSTSSRPMCRTRSRSRAGCSSSVGARYRQFRPEALDRNTNTSRSAGRRQISPRAAVILKPIDTVSLYTAWSISYLPASGDQFSALNDGTLILQPQKFEQHGGRRQVEHQSEAAVHGRGLRSDPDQCADRRPEQSRVLLPVRSAPDPRL